MNNGTGARPCISFFDEGDDVRAYVHLPGRKIYCGEETRFDAGVFDRDLAQLSDHVGIRIIGYLFKGSSGCFDRAELSETAIVLRVDRTHLIAKNYIFGARKKRMDAENRSKSRKRLSRLLFSIHDHIMLGHLYAVERRAKVFFEMEIERAINFAVAIEES